MKIRRVCATFFSATGNTKKAATALAEQLAQRLDAPLVCFDFTLPGARGAAYSFEKEDVVVFGLPVYAGRVPSKLLPFMQSGFFGNGALAVPIVTFGNRAFDGAWAELCELLRSSGFLVVGGAALAARHAFSAAIGSGRPDDADGRELRLFAERMTEKIKTGKALQTGGIEMPTQYYTPKDEHGKPAMFLKAKPSTNKALCERCGACVAACPMGSIDAEANVFGVCIKCHACIQKCPSGAKFFEDAAFLSHVKMLEKHCTKRQDNQMFL